MSEHPEFPNETPAMKYIISQVAQIEGALACSKGYYDNQAKFLRRLEKTDDALSLLAQETATLRKFTDAKIISQSIDRNTHELEKTLEASLRLISDLQSLTVREGMEKIRKDQEDMIKKNIHAAGLMVMGAHKLDQLIEDFRARAIPPMWKIYAGWCISLLIGLAIGYFMR